MQLSAPARRVLGALIEKAMATPQGYPLSLNALRTACNQTTNRDPVVDYDDITTNDGLKELRGFDLVRTEYAARSNTPKHAHTVDEYFELTDGQTALLGVLLLRGPQTVGELRQRTDRMHGFEDLEQVHHALQALADHVHGPLARELPRQPGQKETRWIHLLGEDGDDGAPAAAASEAPTAAQAAAASAGTSGTGVPPTVPPTAVPTGAPTASVADLAEEVETLRDELDTLAVEVERLRRIIDERGD